MEDLGTLGFGGSSEAVAVDNGQVVGSAETASGATPCLQLDRGRGDGGPRDPRRKLQRGPMAVHDGQVVGWAGTASGATHAFSWTAAGGMVDLGTLGGSFW